jgi:hypothetical protein
LIFGARQDQYSAKDAEATERWRIKDRDCQRLP